MYFGMLIEDFELCNYFGKIIAVFLFIFVLKFILKVFGNEGKILKNGYFILFCNKKSSAISKFVLVC